LGELTIGACPPNLIGLLWDQVEALILDVVEKAPDDISVSHTKKQLEAGEVLLVTISDGAELVAINVLNVSTLDTGLKVLYIPITSGTRMDEWLDDFMVVAHQMAKDYECTQIRGLSVRKGWLKKLEDHHWSECFTTIKCDVK